MEEILKMVFDFLIFFLDRIYIYSLKFLKSSASNIALNE